MDKVQLAKQISRFTIMLGTGKIVYGIVDKNTDPEKVTDKVAIKATSFVVGAMATTVLADHVDQKIDEFVAWWKTNTN